MTSRKEIPDIYSPPTAPVVLGVGNTTAYSSLTFVPFWQLCLVSVAGTIRAY